MDTLYPSKNISLPFPIESYPFQYKNMMYLGYYVEAVLNGQYCVLCHYAINSWKDMRQGSWLLHGHEHSDVKNHLPEGTDGKILDTGWDYFKKPLSLSDIKKIMESKIILSVGHH
jgi:calcineurin-like phosphoesterase family protein